MHALIALEQARIGDSGGADAPLTLRGGERRVALVGNFRPLFRLLSGEARLVSGTVEIAGVPATEAVRRGKAGLALLDPPLVPAWTLERFLLESARLAGLEPADSERSVEAALAYFELGGLRRTRLQTLFPPVRRAALLAHATLTAPEVICAEAPLSDLDAEGQAYVAQALERAAEGRALLASVPALLPEGAERALVERADFVVEEHAGRIVRQGPALERGAQRYFVTVTRAGQEFLSALAERGLAARPTPIVPVRFGEPAANASGSLRVVVELSSARTTGDVLSAAHAAGAPVVELTAV
jgi:ABC-type Na+ transport system ATPase subunit NatA